MSRYNNLILFLFAASVIISCSPAITTTRLVTDDNKPTSYDQPITMYSTIPPACPYRELAIVESRQRNKYISMDEVVESLKEEARTLGGDAIIGGYYQPASNGRN